ncbi:MAG: substrate-binding domain-containing protein [Planktomarina sp.]
MRLFLTLILTWFTLPAFADTMRMAVTTSFHNSGLADVLGPMIKEDTGIDMQLLVVGTGQALKLGQAGDVDAVLVHAKAAEDAFVAAGHSPYRREIMYNDFVVIGPATDPAHLSQAKNASDAFARLQSAQATFVSRGDDSGTHKAEQALWPTPPIGAWYKEAGSGMGATLNTAMGLGAYVLTDRASWLNFGNKSDDMAIVFENDPALFNQYTLLPVSAVRHPHIRSDLAAEVENWLASATGQATIAGYTLQDKQLFFPNATAK